MRNRKDGFTLVEIFIILTIIALLAAIAIPSFQKARTTARLNQLSLEQVQNSNFIIDTDSKEVVEVNKDITTVTKRVGKITCNINEFKAMDSDKDRSEYIQYYNRPNQVGQSNLASPTSNLRSMEELLGKAGTETPSLPDEITINGVKYIKVK